MSSIREARLLVHHDGIMRKICKLALSGTDASLYLFPYSLLRRYHFGLRQLDGNQEELSFFYKEDAVSSRRVPKLSIHQTGQVHIRTDEGNVGPLRIPPLSELQGEHVASISVDSFDACPVYHAAPRTKGQTVDIPLPRDAAVVSGVIAVYVNGGKKEFLADCPVVVTMQRPSLFRPLFVGFRPRAQEPLGIEDGRHGTTVIAGWDPTLPNTEPNRFLYIRGE